MATIIKQNGKTIIQIDEEDIISTSLDKNGPKPLKQKPPVVYHYTSIDTFKAILKSRTLRFTNLRDVNDMSEYYYGLRLLLDKITKYEIKRGIALRNRIPHAFFKHFFSDSANNLYSASFTENGDDIVFWNSYYIKPNNAVAIGFNTAKLETENYLLNHCIYGDPYPAELNAGAYEMLLGFYKHPERLHKDMRFLQMTFNPACIKDKRFEPEKEWRLVSPPISGLELKTFNRGNKRCRCFDSPIRLDTIIEVVVGPGEEQFRNLDLVNELAKINGINAVISHSTIPINL